MVQFYKPKKRTQMGQPHILNNLSIDRLSDDGRGIAKLPSSHSSAKGKTVFVEGALPSEKVNIQLTKQGNRYAEAVVLEILEESTKRVEPQCTHYSSCGGCHVQHMSIEQQHLFKQSTLLNQLKKWSDLEVKELLPIISSDPFHYRRRVRLGVIKTAKQQVMLGFRQKNSRQIININHCPIMDERLERLIPVLQQWLNQHVTKVSHIELIDSIEAVGVVIRFEHVLSLNIRQDLEQALASMNAVCWFQGDKKGSLEQANGEKVEPYLYYKLSFKALPKPLLLGFHPQDFIQSNAAANALLVEQAIRLLKPSPKEKILDLFCGIGNFSLALSGFVAEILGVEGVDSMIATANFNAQNNKIKNARFLQADLFDMAEMEKKGLLSSDCDGLILDPPRAGAKVLCENINKLMPKRIVYISCDSATFTRDALILCKNGFELSQLGVIDMFPQTYHSEVMGLFVHPSWQCS